MHKDVEENKKKCNHSYQNYIYQFHCKGDVLFQNPWQVPVKPPGFHGTQFENYDSTALNWYKRR